MTAPLQADFMSRTMPMLGVGEAEEGTAAAESPGKICIGLSTVQLFVTVANAFFLLERSSFALCKNRPARLLLVGIADFLRQLFPLVILLHQPPLPSFYRASLNPESKFHQEAWHWTLKTDDSA